MSYVSNQRHKNHLKTWYYYKWSWTNDPVKYLIIVHHTVKEMNKRLSKQFKQELANKFKNYDNSRIRYIKRFV